MLTLLAVCALPLMAQDDTPPVNQEMPPSVYYPAPKAAWSVDAAVGIRVLTVPRDIAEEEMNKAPSLDVHAVLALPWQFSLNGRMEIQYFTNNFRAGLRWSQRLGDFGVAVGDDIAFWFGFFDFEGFDNRMSGSINYPNIAVGHDFGDVRLTAQGEAIVLFSQRSFAGENEVASAQHVLAGGALSLVLEQPVWHHTHVLLGIRLAWTEFHYQTWFAFSTFNRKLLFSELLFGVLL
ncbi:MAG: hypothetical protein WBQ23_03890 [Bacteroidota bacterium]